MSKGCGVSSAFRTRRGSAMTCHRGGRVTSEQVAAARHERALTAHTLVTGSRTPASMSSASKPNSP
eukprot:scaffold4567_cov92-Isochrysis_galbana.AAC.2